MVKSWKLLLLVTLPMVVISSCYTKKQAVKRFCSSKSYQSDTTQKIDSIHSKSSTVILDSQILKPATNLELSINPCDSLGRVIDALNVKLKSGNDLLDVQSRNGQLLIRCNCDSALSRIRKEVRDSVANQYQSLNSKTSQTIYLPGEVVYKTPSSAYVIYILLSLLCGLSFYLFINEKRRNKR